MFVLCMCDWCKKFMVFQQNAFAPQAQKNVALVAGAVPPTRPVSVKSKLNIHLLQCLEISFTVQSWVFLLAAGNNETQSFIQGLSRK